MGLPLRMAVNNNPFRARVLLSSRRGHGRVRGATLKRVDHTLALGNCLTDGRKREILETCPTIFQCEEDRVDV